MLANCIIFVNLQHANVFPDVLSFTKYYSSLLTVSHGSSNLNLDSSKEKNTFVEMYDGSVFNEICTFKLLFIQT